MAQSYDFRTRYVIPLQRVLQIVQQVNCPAKPQQYALLLDCNCSLLSSSLVVL